jgi:hypothetical protein
MHLKRLRARVLATALAVTPLVVVTTVTTGCATTSAKHVKKENSKAKEEKFKNYSLYRNKDLNWKILRQGQKEMGGAALDSY